MLAPALRSVWAHDLPLCFPGRACVDVPPGGAQTLYLISDLSPLSPGIAAALWAGLGVSLVLLGIGLRLHWRGRGLRPWSVLLAIALVVSGTALAWATGAWSGEAALIYGGFDGRPAETTPSSIIGSWPLVQAAGCTGAAVGAIVLFLMLNTAAVHRSRTARAREVELGQLAQKSARKTAQ